MFVHLQLMKVYALRELLALSCRGCHLRQEAVEAHLESRSLTDDIVIQPSETGA
jgi:hypothetical protein